MTQHDSWACSRVGWTIPATHAKANSLRIEHPIRTLAYRNLSLVGRIGIFVSHTITVSFNNDPLPVMHQPVDQGRCQGVVHVKDFAPVPEGSIRGDHDRSNFITGGDNLEQQIGPMLVDGQIAQLIEDGNSGTHQAPSIHELDGACQCTATLVLAHETSEPVPSEKGEPLAAGTTAPTWRVRSSDVLGARRCRVWYFLSHYVS